MENPHASCRSAVVTRDLRGVIIAEFRVSVYPINRGGLSFGIRYSAAGRSYGRTGHDALRRGAGLGRVRC